MLKTIIEIGASLSLFANAVLFIPQGIQLLRVKKSNELSLATFLGFNLIQIFVVLHGFINHDNILIYGMGISFFTCAWVTYLIIYYRLKNCAPRESV